MSEVTPNPPNLLRSIAFYAVVFAGFGLLVASVFVIFTKPLWLVLFIPLLGLWSVWLLNVYWNWVRQLGR